MYGASLGPQLTSWGLEPLDYSYGSTSLSLGSTNGGAGQFESSIHSVILALESTRDPLALEDHEGTVSIGGRTITNLRFADDIDGLAGEEEELAKLDESLDKAFTTYSMKISAEKTKLVKNNTSDIKKEIKVNRPSLETVTSFKYLGSVVSDECSKTEILFRIAKTTAILTSLE